jgi:hypothetical protein
VTRWYLAHSYFATTPARRLLRLALRAAVTIRLFERLLPATVVVADRGGGDDAG